MQIQDLTTDEFKALVKEAFSEVLEEFFDDPDEGKELQEDVKRRLIEYRKEKETGIQGIPAEEVAKRFGL